jgi:hypothetical protein
MSHSVVHHLLIAGQDSVVVHNWQIESIEDNIPDTPKVIPIDKGCLEIKLSSKGAVLLMFNNRLVMHIEYVWFD